ncbi:histidine kinase [Paracoccus sediminis]|uniref:Histidine kinase n=1 Tax=Paracoccus sediminis TaxID=1214787 RepID=A0A238UTA2_9RHOB|nr:DUF6446 family protein [Paracoccus sediminis]TBN52829.1 histidine kinase [Paracoccus sediminis]SNR25400.1 hypothetical protein SAMN06265378_101407 [Paracoccus sediminis]
MNGKIIGIGLPAIGVIAGGGLWYLQEYHFYNRLPAAETITVQTASGPETLPVTGFQGIDADNSPLRWRACAVLAAPPVDPVPFQGATPLGTPGWFDCFDYGRLTEDLESGAAQAVLSQSEIRPDVDRVLAIYPDGRVYGWHQYNDKTPERGVMD